MGHKDLRLGKIVYILVFYNISFSWFLPLDGFQFKFLLRDSENDLFAVADLQLGEWGVSKNIFSAPWASFWSKIKGGPPLDALLIRSVIDGKEMYKKA